MYLMFPKYSQVYNYLDAVKLIVSLAVYHGMLEVNFINQYELKAQTFDFQLSIYFHF